MSKKYNRQTDGAMVVHFYFIGILKSALNGQKYPLSNAKTSPDKLRKYIFVLNVITVSWQRSLAAEMCYILSNTSQKGRQIETHCLSVDWTFYHFESSFFPVRHSE